MTNTPDLKSRWYAANAVVEQLEEERHKLIEHTEVPYHAALDALKQLDDECDALGAIRCVSCAGPLFEGDPYFGTDDAFCAECAPTYQELLDEPEFFVTADGEQATPEQCRAWYDAHIAGGGLPTDTMAHRVLGAPPSGAHGWRYHALMPGETASHDAWAEFFRKAEAGVRGVAEEQGWRGVRLISAECKAGWFSLHHDEGDARPDADFIRQAFTSARVPN